MRLPAMHGIAQWALATGRHLALFAATSEPAGLLLHIAVHWLTRPAMCLMAHPAACLAAYRIEHIVLAAVLPLVCLAVRAVAFAVGPVVVDVPHAVAGVVGSAFVQLAACAVRNAVLNLPGNVTGNLLRHLFVWHHVAYPVCLPLAHQPVHTAALPFLHPAHCPVALCDQVTLGLTVAGPADYHRVRQRVHSGALPVAHCVHRVPVLSSQTHAGPCSRIHAQSYAQEAVVTPDPNCSGCCSAGPAALNAGV